MSAPWPIWVLFGAPVAALLVGYFYCHQRCPERTHWPILASCAATALAALWLAFQVYEGAGWDFIVYRWAAIGGFTVDFGVRLDGLSASVLAMVCVVSGLIHIYAVGYMEGEPGTSRFFLYFHLFFLSMLGLLVSNNYLQTYVFWEGVGLASFLLIGFWYPKESARRASWKAFLTNRVGDIGFILAIFLLLREAGSVRFEEVFARLGNITPGMRMTIGLLLFWGAAAKSAQFPLHVWLPDAMEGPTPVSALMHAATMVTAGVFLMARSMPLLESAPPVLAVITVAGLITAIGAAIVSVSKRDLKRILAYSTVSQLGLMMVAIGTGNLVGAVFHLITHGFFKALLFLCAGSVIHGLHSSLHGAVSAGVDDAGGLGRDLPYTGGAFLVGALALSGVPPLAGFFSKDLILEGALESGHGLAALTFLIALGSSLYIFRMLLLTFFGARAQQRGPKAHAHEPGLLMRVPVLILAVLSASAGVFGGTVARMLGFQPPHFVLGVAVSGTLVAAAGFGVAYFLTMSRPSFDWEWRARFPWLERWLECDFGWQKATDAIAGGGAALAHFVAGAWESRRWDPFTESLATGCVQLGEGLSAVCRGRLNEYVWWMFVGAAALAFTVLLCF
ncbi:MAG: hypothetical protein A2X36_03550 [Elusimicrobia bacterium GWA2_69_24]|nr:MAG: hypothetical protein A2X36_03550 [Elusimicrobia bacterium GWA2_69_24]HBL18831.1 NADH-quinone oxidoreductase subunit L [Elusimicrobiota bacterium]